MIFPGQINTYIADEQLPWKYMWIEFDGLRVKEALSVTDLCKDVPIYHSHSKELREKLADEIKKGKLIPFNQFKEIFDDFIINILNKRPSQGKNLKGLSPDELFNSEFNMVD